MLVGQLGFRDVGVLRCPELGYPGFQEYILDGVTATSGSITVMGVVAASPHHTHIMYDRGVDERSLNVQTI